MRDDRRIDGDACGGDAPSQYDLCKKTAERMVLELKDKLEGVAPVSATGQIEKPMATLSVVEQDVISALLNLGCNRATADAAVRKAKAAGTAGEFEPLFRKSLELVR